MRWRTREKQRKRHTNTEQQRDTENRHRHIETEALYLDEVFDCLWPILAKKEMLCHLVIVRRSLRCTEEHLPERSNQSVRLYSHVETGRVVKDLFEERKRSVFPK